MDPKHFSNYKKYTNRVCTLKLNKNFNIFQFLAFLIATIYLFTQTQNALYPKPPPPPSKHKSIRSKIRIRKIHRATYSATPGTNPNTSHYNSNTIITIAGRNFRAQTIDLIRVSGADASGAEVDSGRQLRSSLRRQINRRSANRP